MKGTEKKTTEKDGFWKRNWLILLLVATLTGSGIKYMDEMYSISPYLLIMHLFALYIAIVALIYINIKHTKKLLNEIRTGGYNLWKAIYTPIKAIGGKIASGLDLITRRMGADQEIAIAEKQKKKLEIELMQKKLKTEINRIEETTQAAEEEQEGQKEKHTTTIIPEPECSKYGETVIKYLTEVNWNAFTVTQCQHLLHKRFGTAKLVLEVLVDKGKLEYVNIGKRKAYRLVSDN